MTHYTEEITLDQQRRFFERHLHPVDGDGKYLAYLLLNQNKTLGFGLLREDGDKYWMTIGLAKDSRGQRLSGLLTNLITSRGVQRHKEVWLDVWKDNFVVDVYLDNGYEIMTEEYIDGRVLFIMKYKGQ